MNPLSTFRRNVAILLVIAALTLSLFWVNSRTAAQGGQVQVTAADPASTSQGTINLNVKVNGKGFKNGAKAKWFVTGTTDPGGVTVNSTTFVSSSELTANITVSDTATIANFDIQVTNSDGRGGKGTELFAVTAKGGGPTSCSTLPFPSGITYLGGLNDGSRFTNGLGNALHVARMTLGATDVLVLAAGQNGNGSGTVEVYFVDPNTGTLLDGTNIGSATEVQPHISVPVPGGIAIRSISGGDINADGITDFALGSPAGAAFAMVGIVSNGVLSYQVVALPAPAKTNGFGASTAMGDLDGISGDEIAVGATGGGTGSAKNPGKVAIFKFNGVGFDNTLTISSPIPNSKLDDSFGGSVAIGNVTGSSTNDLIVGASGSTVSGIDNAGRIYVFPEPINASNYQTLVTGIRGDSFGSSVVTGNVDGGIADVIGATSGTSPNPRANVYSGATSTGQSANFVLPSISGRTGLWLVGDSGDLNGDGLDEVLIGAATGCGGTAYLYMSSAGAPLTTNLAFQSPVSGVTKFGSSVSIGPGSRLFFVGDSLTTVGSTFSNNGQVHVFKVN